MTQIGRIPLGIIPDHLTQQERQNTKATYSDNATSIVNQTFIRNRPAASQKPKQRSIVIVRDKTRSSNCFAKFIAFLRAIFCPCIKSSHYRG